MLTSLPPSLAVDIDPGTTALGRQETEREGDKLKTNRRLSVFPSPARPPARWPLASASDPQNPHSRLGLGGFFLPSSLRLSLN